LHVVEEQYVSHLDTPILVVLESNDPTI
jgi:hypothetical protein